MREIVALISLYGCYNIIIGENAPWISLATITLSVIIIFYLAMCLATRFVGISKWFRIHPGQPTEMDEGEWRAMDDKRYAQAAAIRSGIEVNAGAMEQAPSRPRPPATSYAPASVVNADRAAMTTAAADQAPRPEVTEAAPAPYTAAKKNAPPQPTAEEIFEDIFRAGD